MKLRSKNDEADDEAEEAVDEKAKGDALVPDSELLAAKNNDNI